MNQYVNCQNNIPENPKKEKLEFIWLQDNCLKYKPKFSVLTSIRATIIRATILDRVLGILLQEGNRSDDLDYM